MPYGQIKFPTGMSSESSPVLAEASWQTGNQIRWWYNTIQPLGGWLRLTSQPVMGTCRSLFGWTWTDGTAALAIGTNSHLQVYIEGSIYDITPVLNSDNFAPSMQTTLGSHSVLVSDATLPGDVTVGSLVQIVTGTALGGLSIYGFYLVQSMPGANEFVITAAGSVATSTAGPGGTVTTYTTVSSSRTVTATLNNHNFTTGDVYTIGVVTAVGGITLAKGNYTVTSTPTVNTFTFLVPVAAGTNSTSPENGGDMRVNYLLMPGA